jgi:calcineurin-like phosphoesterase family protein
MRFFPHIPTNPPPQYFQLHGHVHDKRPNTIISNQLNLCVEVWEYQPVAEKQLISLLDKACLCNGNA